MKNNKFLYLLITVIFIYFTGCEGSDPARNPTEKKDAPNQAAVPKKKESWKGGSSEAGKKPLRKSENNELLKETIYEAISRKPKGHDFDIERKQDEKFVPRHMSVTGG